MDKDQIKTGALLKHTPSRFVGAVASRKDNEVLLVSQTEKDTVGQWSQKWVPLAEVVPFDKTKQSP